MKVMNQKPAVASIGIGLVPVSFSKEPESGSPVPSDPDTASMMEYLKETYKNVQFDFLSFENKGQIAQYGATKQGINNVAISPVLLQKMCSDEGMRQKVEIILSNLNQYQSSAKLEAFLFDRDLQGMGLVLDDDGNVSKWTATQKREPQKPPAYWRSDESSSFYSTKDKNKKNKQTTTYKYSHSSSMIQLAGAKNVSSVRGLIAAKQGEIPKVKAAVQDPVEAAAIIRKIKKFVQSGQIKIARLHKEENLERQRRAAMKRMERKLERQLAEELRRKRTARKGQEHCQTADMDDVMGKPSLSDARFQQILQQYAQNVYPDGQGSGGVSAAGGAAPAVDVSVSTVSTATIDCVG